MLIKTGWDKKYRYNSFAVNNRIVPPTNYYSVMMPDYLIFTFDINIWTGYVSQMNKIIEKFIYHEGTYWGDKDKNLFKCNINNYDNTIDVESGQDRAIRNNFTLEVNGYILPESYKNKITTVKRLKASRIVLGFETERDLTIDYNTNSFLGDILVTADTLDSVLTGLGTTLNIIKGQSDFSPIQMQAELDNKVDRRNEDDFVWILGEY